MNELHLSRLQKNIIFILFIALTFLILYSIFNVLENSGKYTLGIDTIPSDATISVNGVVSPSNISLYPGVYSVVTTKDGFTDSIRVVDVSKDLTIKPILIPASSTAKKWAVDNASVYPEDFFYDSPSGQQPITDYLPDSNYIYSISTDSTTVGPTPLRLFINSSSGYYNAPIDRIRSMGFTPEDYLYTFRFGNPFK